MTTETDLNLLRVTPEGTTEAVTDVADLKKPGIVLPADIIEMYYNKWAASDFEGSFLLYAYQRDKNEFLDS